MAGGSFSSFSLLPGEIRDQIWDFSTRPIGARGVQYFSVLQSWDNTSPIPEVFKGQIVNRTSKYQNQILAAPLVGDDTSCPSWYEGNQSTYAIDGGLWTACKESRAAMYRRYKPEEWVDFRKKQRKHCDDDKTYLCDSVASKSKNEQMPATFNVECSGRTQSLTILPGYDLLHLAPQETGADWNTLLHYMPFSSLEFGFGGIRHVAMDFDPSWSLEELGRYRLGWERSMNFEEHTEEDELDILRWEMYDCLVKATREMVHFSNPMVWLVDHRLRRKSTVLDEHMTEMVFGRYGSWKNEQLVFHAAGCRYYAMPNHYASQFCGYDAEDDPGCDDDVFSFVSELEDVGARQEALENRGDVDGSDDENKYYATTLRILLS
ncbi:hypothetical protein CGLO_10397 [Colletotrichum gloeosporioides Cg-14]|uniref:2EXR domain-containing protein n=1 Tax=Colletotrichum gloeosporioides (strain Cg-14) TaxID=1237896 RepID=T0K3N6_COLGC|nr:hypothetical protein CGLO_10397 [Colletotrichum gloeosporioides Cg-14]